MQTAIIIIETLSCHKGFELNHFYVWCINMYNFVNTNTAMFETA